jgi:DMSO/TMAO reductase YedYZ heme-binding membrane subunit
VASTRSRPSGREHARPTTGGVTAEHATKIYTIAGTGVVVIVAFLTLTSIGHVIDAATQHFMLFYAGVFALIGLCASVGLGLVATDRMFLNPGHRVLVQSAHRAASFGAVTFLIIHIVTEILAQRVHMIDAVIPFLSPFRTFYIGLGTIASDLIILMAITGILRGRFNASGKAWRWRAIHYTSYLAFVFGVWHGLLGGRPGKPYVDWSYGFVVALVLLGLAVRVLSRSLKPKQNLSAPPAHATATSVSAPLRAAAMAAQLSAARSGRGGFGAVSGGQPVLAPLGAPVLTATALPAAGAQASPGRPYYEPGYEGPPRYLGAPRSTGPQPQAATGPLPRAATGPLRRATGPMPAADTTGPLPPYSSRALPRAPTGPMPAAGTTGPQPPYPSGPQPPYSTGPLPRATGPMLAADTGPLRPYNSGPLPRAATGPIPRSGTGPMPRPGTGPLPRAATGPIPRPGTGPLPRAATGPIPRPGTGPLPRAATGPLPRAAGPQPPAATGPFRGGDIRPQSGPGTGPLPRAATGPQPQAGRSGRPGWDGPQPRPATGPIAWPGADPRPRGATGPTPGATGPRPRPAPRNAAWPPPAWPGGAGAGRPDRSEWTEAGHDGSWYPDEPPWDGGFPETDPGLRYREPGPGMPGYRGSRDHRYGGDRR